MTFNAFKIIIQLSSARGVADVYDFGKRKNAETQLEES